LEVHNLDFAHKNDGLSWPLAPICGGYWLHRKHLRLRRCLNCKLVETGRVF